VEREIDGRMAGLWWFEEVRVRGPGKNEHSTSIEVECSN